MVAHCGPEPSLAGVIFEEELNETFNFNELVWNSGTEPVNDFCSIN
jgi:hypothetical protein